MWGYQDIGVLQGVLVLCSVMLVMLGLNLCEYGLLSMVYVCSKSLLLFIDFGISNFVDSEIVIVIWFKLVGNMFNFYFMVYCDFWSSGYGVIIGLIIFFGGCDVVGVSVSNNNGQWISMLQVSCLMVVIGDFGW